MDNFEKSLLWAGLLSILLVIFNFFYSKNPANLRSYPQIRRKHWGPGLFTLSAVSWGLYLFAYEFMFRGFLLFTCWRAFGMWPAVALNVAFYSAAHFSKGLKESVAAVPFGLILCLITLQTGTVWAAFISHGVLALSNEWFSLAAHSGIKLSMKKESGK
jgi:membrane protease YdiL (CAAX protease family)